MGKTIKKDDVQEIIKADFGINRLQMDAKLCWLLDIEVLKVLPETFLLYKLDLVFNEQPYLEAIKRIEKEIEDVDREPNLFESMKTSKVKILKRQIQDTKDDMAALKKDCPTLTMNVTVTELKYKLAKTFVRMRLPDDKINELNDNKHKFRHYQAELTPILPEEQEKK